MPCVMLRYFLLDIFTSLLNIPPAERTVQCHMLQDSNFHILSLEVFHDHTLNLCLCEDVKWGLKIVKLNFENLKDEWI
jgi:hypothetical protein